MKNNIQSLRKIVWENNLGIFRDKLTYKHSLSTKRFFGNQILMLKMKNFVFFVAANLSKNHKNDFFPESVTIKEQKESNSCQKYDFSINAF